MKASIVIPAYNEMHTIGQVVSMVKSQELECDKEILIVNDGSTDGTHEIASRITGVKYIKLNKNRGKGAAVQKGIENATGDIIIIQDADLEYDPDDIPRIVSPILNGEADVVYGSRILGSISGMSTLHYFGNLILTFATSVVCGVRLTDMMTGFKAFTKTSLNGMGLHGRGFELEPEITVRLTQKRLRFTEVPINYSYRKKGKAKISWTDGIRCLWCLFSERIRSIRSRTPQKS